LPVTIAESVLQRPVFLMARPLGKIESRYSSRTHHVTSTPDVTRTLYGSETKLIRGGGCVSAVAELADR
jgi:hypothetical protein